MSFDVADLRRQLRAELGDQSKADQPSWLLMGSAVLLLHGLRDEVGDIDLFVTPTKWGELIDRGWRWETPQAGDPPIAAIDLDGLPTVNAFFDWDRRHGYAFSGAGIVREGFAEAEWFDGFWSQSLEQLRQWKVWLYAQRVHEKHGRDADAIGRYLLDYRHRSAGGAF